MLKAKFLLHWEVLVVLRVWGRNIRDESESRNALDRRW